jgi:hypothetical protein
VDDGIFRHMHVLVLRHAWFFNCVEPSSVSSAEPYSLRDALDNQHISLVQRLLQSTHLLFNAYCNQHIFCSTLIAINTSFVQRLLQSTPLLFNAYYNQHIFLTA